MSKRIFLLALALLTVGIISALFLLNPQGAVVNLGGERTYQAPMALVLILTFVAGGLFTFILTFISQFRLALEAWRERRLRAAERGHLKELVAIRELIALEKYSEAIPRLSQILKEDPDNAACRALLASCQDSLDDSSAALRTLEEGRGRIITSAELYLKAALIYEKRGNLTAALDNMALLLKSHPTSKKVLREGVRIAEKLGEGERAIQFQERLLKLLSGDEYQAAQEKLAALELKRIEKQPRAVQSEELSRLLKRHRTFAPAFQMQAELDELRGEVELANRSLVRGFGLSGDISFLSRIASLWLKRDNPERAVKNIRAAVGERDSEEGRAYLACLLASLGIMDEAEKELSRLQQYHTPLKDLAQLMIAERSAGTQPTTAAVQISSRVKERLISELPEGLKESLQMVQGVRLQTKGAVRFREQPSPQYSTP